ncbi:MAG: Sec-independent protein translocase subunit TatA/TatB [Candidatus Dormibacteria bacterium]
MGVSHLPILIILAVVALVVFGPKRLPELGHGLGKAITEFKKGAAELTGSHDHVVASSTEPTQPSVAISSVPAEPQPAGAAPVTEAATRA